MRFFRWLFGNRHDGERRQIERRSESERRSSLRWDPRAPERERRANKDRRR